RGTCTGFPPTARARPSRCWWRRRTSGRVISRRTAAPCCSDPGAPGRCARSTRCRCRGLARRSPFSSTSSRTIHRRCPRMDTGSTSCESKEAGNRMQDLLRTTAERAARYLADLKDRGVAPTPEALANLRRLDEPLPEHPTDPSTVIRLLDDIGSPATMASAGGRFLRFVVGGSLPAAVAASSLAAAWGLNAGIVVLSA